MSWQPEMLLDGRVRPWDLNSNTDPEFTENEMGRLMAEIQLRKGLPAAASPDVDPNQGRLPRPRI